MGILLSVALAVTAAVLALVGWAVYHLLKQNGRILLRLDALEQRLGDVGAAAPSRFGDRSLAASRINRDGLTPGTLAPVFCLPRADGGELSLDEYAGRRVLLVFSDPGCEPCDRLGPKLARLARQTSDLAIVMVSRGGAEINRRKIAELGMPFPVVLQSHWEISRQYAKFVTPIAYLIDENGRVAANVAVGEASILTLASTALSTDRAVSPPVEAAAAVSLPH